MKSIYSLLSFAWYCITHRDERFWQALRNWSYAGAIYWESRQAVQTQSPTNLDTFYWNDRCPPYDGRD
jgi:hypothetical protein